MDCKQRNSTVTKKTPTASKKLPPFETVLSETVFDPLTTKVVLSFGVPSRSPKHHPSKPHPCNMPQAKTEVALQFSES